MAGHSFERPAKRKSSLSLRHDSFSRLYSLLTKDYRQPSDLPRWQISFVNIGGCGTESIISRLSHLGTSRRGTSLPARRKPRYTWSDCVSKNGGRTRILYERDRRGDWERKNAILAFGRIIGQTGRYLDDEWCPRGVRNHSRDQWSVLSRSRAHHEDSSSFERDIDSLFTQLQNLFRERNFGNIRTGDKDNFLFFAYSRKQKKVPLHTFYCTRREEYCLYATINMRETGRNVSNPHSSVKQQKPARANNVRAQPVAGGFRNRKRVRRS